MILICILIVSKFNRNWNISEWIYVSILSNLQINFSYISTNSASYIGEKYDSNKNNM